MHFCGNSLYYEKRLSEKEKDAVMLKSVEKLNADIKDKRAAVKAKKAEIRKA